VQTTALQIYQARFVQNIIKIDENLTGKTAKLKGMIFIGTRCSNTQMECGNVAGNVCGIGRSLEVMALAATPLKDSSVAVRQIEQALTSRMTHIGRFQSQTIQSVSCIGTMGNKI